MLVLKLGLASSVNAILLIKKPLRSREIYNEQRTTWGKQVRKYQKAGIIGSTWIDILLQRNPRL